MVCKILKGKDKGHYCVFILNHFHFKYSAKAIRSQKEVRPASLSCQYRHAPNKTVPLGTIH